MQPAEQHGPLVAEGTAYAAAFLERVALGASSPDELASLMQFLHSGDLMHGACVAIHEALRQALQRPANA